VGPSTAQLASAKNATSLTATWTAPAQPADSAAITAYRVAAIGGEFTGQEVAVRTSGTSATIQGLTANEEYDVKIEAYNGQWSPPISVGKVVVGSGAGGTTTPPGGGDPGTGADTAPLAPADVKASANSDGGADVSWTASTGASSYTVTATTSATGAATPQPVTVQAPETKGVLAGLTPGTEYTVSVTATNAVGTSPAGTATVTTNAAVAPKGFNLTRVLPGHESITAEWTAAAPGNPASPITGYDLTATPATNTVGAGPVTTTVTGLTGTVTGLRNGLDYTVTVVAKSGSATTTASKPSNVNNVVKPNDVVTVGRAEYRADKREYRVSGTAQDTTANTVTLSITGTTTVIQRDVPVGADGAWAISARTNITLPAGATLTVTSSSGGSTTVTPTRR